MNVKIYLTNLEEIGKNYFMLKMYLQIFKRFGKIIGKCKCTKKRRIQKWGSDSFQLHLQLRFFLAGYSF